MIRFCGAFACQGFSKLVVSLFVTKGQLEPNDVPFGRVVGDGTDVYNFSRAFRRLIVCHNGPNDSYFVQPGCIILAGLLGEFPNLCGGP